MERRSLFAIGGLALACLGGGVWYVTQSTDEAKIAKVIDEVTKAGDISDGNPVLRGVRVKSAIEKAFAPDARIEVPELGGGSLAEMTTAAIAAPHFLTDGQVRITHLQVTLDEPHVVAKATGTVEFDGHRNGDHRQAERPVDLQLRKIDGDWKIETVRTGAL